MGQGLKGGPHTYAQFSDLVFGPLPPNSEGIPYIKSQPPKPLIFLTTSPPPPVFHKPHSQNTLHLYVSRMAPPKLSPSAASGIYVSESTAPVAQMSMMNRAPVARMTLQPTTSPTISQDLSHKYRKVISTSQAPRELPKIPRIPTLIRKHKNHSFQVFMDDRGASATDFDTLFDFLHTKYFPRCMFGPV